MNTTHYHRLTLAEREDIRADLWAGKSFSDIAQWLNRSVSTVSREVHNHCKYYRCYRAVQAHEQTLVLRHQAKQSKKLNRYPLLQAYVLSRLRIGWSPQQIADRLKTEYPNSMAMRISHESIYTYIYCLPRGSLRKELIKCLRKERNLRKHRKNSHFRRGAIQEAISIHERPTETINRTIPGHWEGDLVMGSKTSNTAIGTLVERTTRFLLLVPLKAHDAYTVRNEFAKTLKQLPAALKLSLTYDRGSEMAEHKLFTKQTRVQVYFADPHSPWQRGTNENTNGLLRQYFPKRIDFNTVSRPMIEQVQERLNDRPRKVLGFRTPNEVYSEILFNQKIALEG